MSVLKIWQGNKSTYLRGTAASQAHSAYLGQVTIPFRRIGCQTHCSNGSLTYRCLEEGRQTGESAPPPMFVSSAKPQIHFNYWLGIVNIYPPKVNCIKAMSSNMLFLWEKNYISFCFFGTVARKLLQAFLLDAWELKGVSKTLQHGCPPT